jgi:MarR family transcriptional regulator, organic hydroperoxide resistance regulator
MPDAAARQLLELYPRIFFACHMRHVRDPKTRRVLSAHQASILDHLDEQEPVTLLDLARHMGVTASTMSLHVERLVGRGYVLRERDTRDARRLRLRISVAGTRVREANSVLDPQRVRAMLARLSAAEQAEGIRGLAILARAASEQVQEQAKRARRGHGRLPQ